MKPSPLFGLKCVLVASVLLISFSLRAVPGDEHWDVQFGWPGPGQTTDSIVAHNGQLYTSGASTTLTNVPLIVWDGWQWSPRAQFYGPSTVIVYDLAFVGDTLYAAGNFTNVNGIAAGGLAKWDGVNWTSVNGFKGTVTGLTVDGANLYVSGIFTNPAVGGAIATNIAYWDGSAWNALGNGLGSVSGSSVHAVAVKDGQVYAAGTFTNSGSQLITNLAVWNGATWSAVGGGVNSFGLVSLAFNGNDLYVGGAFSLAGSTSANLIARWDGTNWFALGTGLSGTEVLSLNTFGGSVYVTGLFTTAGGVHATNVAVWNGSTWAGLGSGFGAQNGTRVYSNGTNVLVGGNFLFAGNLIANGLAAWDGNGWSAIGTPGRINGVNTVVQAFAGTPTNLFVGGSFSAVGQTNASLVAHFDGANWSPMGSGVALSSSAAVVNALAMDDSNNVYVGGSFTFAGSVSTIDIARWDGTNWYPLGNGPGGTVATITVRPDGVYASGAPQSGLNYSGPFFLRWDGTNWNSVIVYNPNDTFDLFPITDTSIGFAAVAFQDTNIYIGGHFSITWHDPSLTVFTNCPNIMRFDGTYARIVGTGLNSNVVAMTVLGTNLYVAGLFTNAGGVTASHIAMWDGNTWWPVGSGVVGNGTVDALTTMGTNLYAGGTFTNMGGVPARRIAKWDGNTWSALGSGVSATVLELYSSGSNLYAGGTLRAAGNMPSEFLGLWNDQVSFKTPQLSNAAWMGNGQFRARVYSVSGTTNVIEATTNFSSWTPVMTNSIGNFDVTDAAAGNYPRRFYRARLVP